MTTTTENETTKTKQVPAFYIFEQTSGPRVPGAKPAGAAFPHKKGKGFTVLIGGKRYAAFPPKTKPAGQADSQPEATEGQGA